MTKRQKLGEIFVEKGLVTPTTLERALLRARRQKKKVGFVLEDIEVITGEELADALAQQYGYRVVSDFARFKFSPDALRLLSVDVALPNLLFPLKVENGRLAIAMADPTDTRIIANIAANHSLKIVPYIATRRDIIAAINRHYLGKTSESSGEERTILVAEDNKLLYTMLSNILTQEGYRVVVAMDGMEAYQTALAEAPQVILTDKEMPKMDGYALLSALKNLPETRLIPVILLTGVADGDEEARAFEKGFFDFMAKPVREATLVTRVKRALQYYGQL